MMKEYSLIAKFSYKNKRFQLLTDADDKYFFLEIKNNKYRYVELEDFVSLCDIFCRYPSAMNTEFNSKNKLNFVPKVIVKGIATVLTLTTLMGCTTTNVSAKKIDDNSNSAMSENNCSETDRIQRNVSFVVEDNDEQLKIDTYLDHPVENYIYVYGMEALNDYLDYNQVTQNQIENVIDKNNNISNKFKNFTKDFIDTLYDKYPECDKRVLYENLKNLKIIECDKNMLTKKSGSHDSYACYVYAENTIYTLEEYEYKKGTWEYQVIFHELCHVLRNGIIEYGKKDIKVSATGNSLSLVTVDEALNSVFTVSLFDYEERDIAYQLQSNYCTLMLECLDNYSLSDYINHSLSYYASKLDEHNGDNNYAKCILTLIDTQYKDFHSDQIEIEQEEYYPIYDYIANMYYRKYINNNMSYDEAKFVADTLVERVTYDVPEEYNIDTNRFYDYLNEYCNSIGIEIKSNTRGH